MDIIDLMDWASTRRRNEIIIWRVPQIKCFGRMCCRLHPRLLNNFWSCVISSRVRVLVNCWKVGRQKMRVKSNIYDACWGNSWVDIQAACAIICSKPGPKTAAKIICFKILHTFCRHHFTCFHKKFAIRSVINQQSKFIIYLLFAEILYFGVNFRGYSKLSVSLH